jgi:hypothetical protein
MRGGVLRHYGGTAFHARNDAVPPRMDEMPGENVGPGERGCVHCSIDLPGCGSVGSWDNAISSGFERLCGLGADLPITRLRRPLSPPTPTPPPRPAPTSPDLETPLPPRPATAPRLRLSVSGMHCVRRCFDRPTSTGARWPAGLPCGVGPRVGTSKPTSPLRRRRRYLATARVLGAKKCADRLATAPGPACADPGRSGRVSSKGSQAKDHSGRLLGSG